VPGGIERAMIYQYTIFVVVAIFAYLIFTEPNASLYIDLQAQGLWINIRRFFLIARMKPRLMYDMWRMRRIVKKIKRNAEFFEEKTSE
jgi:hypothetical protein